MYNLFTTAFGKIKYLLLFIKIFKLAFNKERLREIDSNDNCKAILRS